LRQGPEAVSTAAEESGHDPIYNGRKATTKGKAVHVQVNDHDYVHGDEKLRRKTSDW
jgi:hypothetical protein